MSTRERIIDTAVALFNAQGTAAVSTNHIAQGAGISPGNLYYHFRNKEAIIRAIYARLRPIWEAAVSVPQDRLPTLADLERIIDDHFRILWEYRFFYREMPALLRRDPELLAAYHEVREAGLANVEGLLRVFAMVGVLSVPDPDTTLPELARIIWILADFWFPFAELDRLSGDDVDLAEGRALILRVLAPFYPDDS
ncbi:MAG: TetR/AcrR family transcriptional regulator [Thermomicrobiales bacterium]